MMIKKVRKLYSRDDAPKRTRRPAKAADTPPPKELKKPIPSPDFLRNLPKPPPPRKLKLVFEASDKNSATFLIENRAYPGEVARNAALAERERNLFRNEVEYEEIHRRALEAEKAAGERERTLRELEALLAARETLLDARERRMAKNPALAAGPVLEKIKATLDQREKRLQQAQVELDQREAKIRESEKGMFDADALNRLKGDLERREKELQDLEQALREREEFLETSENLICEKGQMLVERETQLDQREEELQTKAASLGV